MADIWVVNASPLIVLGKAGCLPLLERLARTVIVPAAVAVEVKAGPPGDPAAAWLSTEGAGCIAPAIAVPSSVAARHLGRGESAVIATALAVPGSEAILDDLAARRAASSFGIPLRGTLSVVLTAKQRGLVAQAAPLVDLVQQAGLFLSPALRAQALALVGE